MKKSIKINFDICTFCNHKCTFCSNSDERTLKDIVTTEQFTKVMKNISKYLNIHELALSAKGEVLLNKDLVDIVKIAKIKYNIPYVYFSTNGSKLDKKTASLLLENGIDSIKFSINGFDEKEYKTIHQKDNFLKVIHNLKDLLILKKDFFPNKKIFISALTTKDKNSLEIIFKNLLGDLYSLITDIFPYEFIYTPKLNHFENINLDKKDCAIFPFDTIHINSNCTLGFCCKDFFDEISFGSLLDNDFLELYDGEKFKNLRKSFFNNQFEKGSLCYNCLAHEGLKKLKPTFNT